MVLGYHSIFNYHFQNFLRGEPLNSALLGVSSLVSSYCKEHTDCQDLPEVQAIITQYEELLGTTPQDSAEEDKVILALKVKNMTVGKNKFLNLSKFFFNQNII